MKDKNIWNFFKDKNKYLFIGKLKVIKNIKGFTLLFILLHFFWASNLGLLDIASRFFTRLFFLDLLGVCNLYDLKPWWEISQLTKLL